VSRGRARSLAGLCLLGRRIVVHVAAVERAVPHHFRLAALGRLDLDRRGDRAGLDNLKAKIEKSGS
jgi:hypothetical protein